MTGFHDIRFPDAIARGATGGPEYSTDIVSVASGFSRGWSIIAATAARVGVWGADTGVASRRGLLRMPAGRWRPRAGAGPGG